MSEFPVTEQADAFLAELSAHLACRRRERPGSSALARMAAEAIAKRARPKGDKRVRFAGWDDGASKHPQRRGKLERQMWDAKKRKAGLDTPQPDKPPSPSPPPKGVAQSLAGVAYQAYRPGL